MALRAGIAGMLALVASTSVAVQDEITYPATVRFECLSGYAGVRGWSTAEFDDLQTCLDTALRAFNEPRAAADPPQSQVAYDGDCNTSGHTPPVCYNGCVGAVNSAPSGNGLPYFSICPTTSDKGERGGLHVTSILRCPRGGVVTSERPSGGFYQSGTCSIFVESTRSVPRPPSCRADEPDDGTLVGQPILPASGDKFRVETDWEAPAGDLGFRRIYKSAWGLFSTGRPDANLGDAWTHNHAWRLTLVNDTIQIRTPEGGLHSLFRRAGTPTWDGGRVNADTVTLLPTGDYAYIRASEDATLTFGATGRLKAWVGRNGVATRYVYDAADRLIEVIGPLDRSLRLAYATSGRLSAVTVPGGRVFSYAYTANHLVATASDANGATTRFGYDAAGHLITMVDALGHVTRFDYDSAHRLVEITRPNGLVTSLFWDARDRLVSQTVTPASGGAGLKTLYAYTITGLLARIEWPSGLVIDYQYDRAHRPIGWSNNRGESASFTLDGMGNRTAEQIKNAAGAVAWKLNRSINEINRVSATTQGSNQTNTFGYDANGELVTRTNGLNQSTQYGLDALRRVSSIANAAGGSASLAYDALDGITQATDFKGVATTYARDALGNATTEASADIGSTGTQYDALGLPSRIVDAMGQATQITRDALGRPTAITFADGKTTTLVYDQGATSKGYLSQIVDRSGTTTYARDGFGRVVTKTQALVSGLTQAVGYGYAANGLLATLNYPNASVLGYHYDATGRLTQLSWNGSPLVSNLAWNPMGQPTAWNWAFVSPTLSATRRYDTAARLYQTEFSVYTYDAAGRIANIAQDLLRPADNDPTHSTISGYVGIWNVGYDALGRITRFHANGNATNFEYDANGNRTSSRRAVGSSITERRYAVANGSNRLSSFTQDQGGTRTNVAYRYNANGDLTSDGLRSFSYDAEGRLSAVTTGATDTSPTTRYAHNALGQRVFKTEPLYPPDEGDERDPGFLASLVAFFTRFWSPGANDAEKLGFAFFYDEAGTLLSETGTGGANSAGHTQHIHLPTPSGPMPIAAVIDGRLFAVHSDHLNSPRRLTNSQGQAIWQWAYSAFGDEKPTLATNRFIDPDVLLGNRTSNNSAIVFNSRYPGQYADSESGLFYNYFRSYCPTCGRYTQPDPIGIDGGWNRFDYAFQNPVLVADPFGLDAWGREHWTPARAYTDMAGGTTTYFDPMSRDLFVLPTKNDIVGTSAPGADGPYTGEFTYCEYPNSKEFGTAKWRTTDTRLRWIHGGGKRLGPRALDPHQGWAPTLGCTRAQNVDVGTLCSKSEAWKNANPGRSIPYSRW